MNPDVYSSTGAEDAPPVLLFPPLGRDRQVMSGLVEQLADSYRCIVIDTAGTGQAKSEVDNLSISRFAADGVTTLDQLGIESAHIAGWSMGSAVATQLVLDHPDRATSLITYAPWAGPSQRLTAIFGFLCELALHAPGLEHVEVATLVLLLSPDALNEIEDFPGYVRRTVQDAAYPSQGGLVGHIRACLEHDVRARLAEINCRTLVIAGEYDQLVDVELSREMASLLTAAKVDYVELRGAKASHGLLVERLVEVAEATKRFLER